MTTTGFDTMVATFITSWVGVIVLWCVLELFRAAMGYLRSRRAEQWQEQLRATPESMREGSELVTDPPGKYPWLVGVYSCDLANTKRQYLGSGIIVDSHFVIPEHVIVDVRRETVHVRTYDDKYHQVANWFVIETDLLAAPVVPGYKSGTVRPVAAPVFAKVVACRDASNSSMGVVKHEREIAPSRLSFTGSTTAGFSGSPYTNGIHILGMHMGGGGQGNYGVSASFVVASLRRQRRPESSELLAIRRALRSAKRSDVFVEPTLDDVRIEVNGQFWMIDRSEYDELLEDEQYLEYLLDVDVETQERVLRKNWSRRRDYYDEPDYVPEGNKVDPSFLGVGSHPPDSSGEASNTVTDCRDMCTAKTQNTLTSMEETISGLQEEVRKLKQVCESMRDMLSVQENNFESRMQMNLNSLKQALTEQIECSISNHRCQQIPSGTVTSTDSSGPSNPPAQQDSDNSENTQQSAVRWDGMDLDLQKYLEWKRSVNVYDPEFVHWRAEFLDKLGLNLEQRQALVKRVQHVGRRMRIKNRLQPPTPSNSS